MPARRGLLLILQIAVSLQENNDVHISPAHNPLKVIAGSKFNLTCSTTMTCSTPLIYTWRKPAGIDVNNKVKPSMTFEFHEVETQEEGEYICTVSCSEKKKSKKVRVQVIYAPSKTQISVSTPLMEGNDFVMNCSSDGNPRPKLEWLKKNKPWPANMRRHDGSVSGVLAPGDEGTYECTAKNQQGERKANISLVIHYGPKNTSISASPGSDIPEGGSLQLTCKTQSNPEVTQYKWNKLPEVSLPQGVLVEGSTLTIHSFQGDHQGIYECEAVHQSGKHDRAYVTVTVTQEERLTQEPASPIIGAVFGSLFGGAAAGGIGGFLLAKLLK